MNALNGPLRTVAMVGLLTAAALPVVSAAPSIDAARSRYLEKVAQLAYPPVTAPAGPADLTWELTRGRLIHYTLTEAEHQLALQRFGTRERELERATEGEGVMVVHTRGRRAGADVRVQDLDVRTTVNVEGHRESGSGRMATQVASRLNERGQQRAGDDVPGGIDNLASALFALPPEAVAIGETTEVPLRMGAAVQWGPSPERMATYPVAVTGNALVTVTGYADVDGTRCAVVETQFRLVEADVPRDFPGNAAVVFSGAARTCFDPDARRMVAGAAALLMAIEMEAPPDTPSAGGGIPGMTLLNDTFLQVRLGR